MVNSKNVTFKVNKQKPVEGPPPQPYATVINCRKPSGKRALQGVVEARSLQVPLTENFRRPQKGTKRKREWEDGDKDGAEKSTKPKDDSTVHAAASSQRPFPTQRPHVLKPTRFRRGKTLTHGVDLDCWFTILTFSDPAQLLEMRSKIASCYRFLRDNPTLWKHARSYYYGDELPDPPSELTEFQYAHLRHGHGCMSCKAPSTRKTYWAFLRRWCKSCLQTKTIKESDASSLFKDAEGNDLSYLSKCLPSGIFDSWNNFVGVGPAHTHSLKTVYLLSDVQALKFSYLAYLSSDPAPSAADQRNWISSRQKIIEERRDFARSMESFEDKSRTNKSYSHASKKEQRKLFYAEKAAKLSPPIALSTMAMCPSYKRAIAIPKEPSMTSWLQLKPKLENEARDVLEVARMLDPTGLAGSSAMRESSGPGAGNVSATGTGTTTPVSGFDGSMRYNGGGY
jgi:hypothetical protein